MPIENKIKEMVGRGNPQTFFLYFGGKIEKYAKLFFLKKWAWPSKNGRGTPKKYFFAFGAKNEKISKKKKLKKIYYFCHFFDL